MVVQHHIAKVPSYLDDVVNCMCLHSTPSERYLLYVQLERNKQIDGLSHDQTHDFFSISCIRDRFVFQLCHSAPILHKVKSGRRIYADCVEWVKSFYDPNMCVCFAPHPKLYWVSQTNNDSSTRKKLLPRNGSQTRQHPTTMMNWELLCVEFYCFLTTLQGVSYFTS